MLCLVIQMKHILALVAALILAISPLYAGKPKVTLVSVEQERAAVGSIFMNSGSGRRFICSGSEIGQDSDGNGVFLTARHCVWNEDQNKFYPNEEVSFSPDEKGPFYTTELYAISQTEDLAILKVISAAKAGIPTEVIGDEHSLIAGDPVENISYPFGLGKLEFHGSFVAPLFPNVDPIAGQLPEWKYTMPVDITIAPGSSGSPLFDSKTHLLIGVMVGGFPGAGRLTIAEPISRLFVMLSNLDENSPAAFMKAHLNDVPKDPDEF